MTRLKKQKLKHPVRQNQKERALLLLAFHGFLLTTVATNPEVRTYLATTTNLFGLGGDLAKALLTMMYFTYLLAVRSLVMPR